MPVRKWVVIDLLAVIENSNMFYTLTAFSLQLFFLENKEAKVFVEPTLCVATERKSVFQPMQQRWKKTERGRRLLETKKLLFTSGMTIALNVL